MATASQKRQEAINHLHNIITKKNENSAAPQWKPKSLHDFNFIHFMEE